MMVLIRLSEIFIITGIFRGTLGTITQQIVIFINILSKFFKYTPFRSEKKSYWSISKSRLSLIPPQSQESVRAYARDIFSFTAILEGQFVLRLWMNKPAVNRVCFFTAARRKSSADAVDGTFKGKVSPRLFTSLSSITSTLILTISSSNFLFLRPAGFLQANNVFLLDSFWDLNVWKFRRENGVVVVSQRPLENDLTFTPHLGQNLKWMRTEWTWTQCIHVWCFGWHGSWTGTKMMYCLCGPPNTSVLNTQIETRSDYGET